MKTYRDLEPLLISREDFSSIAQVAYHCDWDQLSSFIREQQNLSLLPKIGQCLYSLIVKFCQGWDLGEASTGCECPKEIMNHLWNGGHYIACDGKRKIHFGLKRSLVEWSYGAYIYKHGFVDTPFGPVQKVHEDSIPVQPKDLKNLSIDHRNNAEFYYEMTKEFICSVKKCAPISECIGCDCVDSCSCSTCSGKRSTLQNRGLTIEDITNY